VKKIGKIKRKHRWPHLNDGGIHVLGRQIWSPVTKDAGGDIGVRRKAQVLASKDRDGGLEVQKFGMEDQAGKGKTEEGHLGRKSTFPCSRKESARAEKTADAMRTQFHIIADQGRGDTKSG